MINFALGSLLFLFALGLLVHEWRSLYRWRKNPEENYYSERMFMRRGTVSILMMLFVVIFRMQSLVLDDQNVLQALAYLGLYMIIILTIFLLALLDFRQNRRAAQALEREVLQLQADTLRLLAEASRQESGVSNAIEISSEPNQVELSSEQKKSHTSDN
jgi:Ca2+/Na+ antiporter